MSEKRRGIGVANVIYPMDAANQSSATAVFVKINHDGSAYLYTGATDLGQGSNTVLMQIASETTGISMDRLRVISSDTELTPYDEGTGASRSTYIVGNAVKAACEEAMGEIFRSAAWHFHFADPSKFYAENGFVYLKGFPEKSISIAQAAWISERERGFSPVGKATFGTLSDDGNAENGHCRNFEKHVFGTHICEVEVDMATGEVDVLRYVAVHDCGKAVNPMLLTGQIEGGIAMGLGQALFENLREDAETGKLLNNSFTDYLLPTSMDMPKQLITAYTETPDPDAPFGALGIGEATPCPVLPAIANAVYDAIGIQICHLPLEPETVLRAIAEKPSNK